MCFHESDDFRKVFVKNVRVGGHPSNEMLGGYLVAAVVTALRLPPTAALTTDAGGPEPRA